MTYQQAIEFLDSFLNYEQVTAYQYPGAFSLGRVERLLEALGNPHRKTPVLHVAGTKGKGSTCVFTSSILRALGLKTGLYTSPHLISFQERIQVDGVMISEQDLVAAVERLRPLAGRDLTYFEVVTICAFLHFEKAGVEAAVIEVGMGGRLDATNVVAPEVTAITPISLDHMPKLGGTLGMIAREKAGILKRGVPAVVAPQPTEAARVIEETAARVGSDLHPLEREVRIDAREIAVAGSLATFETPVRRYEEITVPLLGRHQLMNVAVAIRMIELFEIQRGQTPKELKGSDPKKAKGVRPLLEAVREGIAATRWPGRCQVILGDPPILLDGAQNAESARALVETVGDLFPGRKVTLVVGVSKEKDLEGMVRVWGPWADRIFLTEAPVPRAQAAQRLKAVFTHCHSSPMETGPVKGMLGRASKEAGPEGLVVVAGSLFVAAEALRLLGSAPLPQKEEAGSQKSG